jgi:hypothetical protein
MIIELNYAYLSVEVLFNLIAYHFLILIIMKYQ